MKVTKIMYFVMLCITSMNFSSNVMAIAHYKSFPLRDLGDNLRVMRKNTISFSYRIFTELDCERILGTAQMLEKGYHPIQINVINNTDRYLLISTIMFSFPCYSYESIAQKMQFSLSKRMLAWIFGSLFVDYIRMSNKLSSLLLAPAVLEAIACPKANEKLLADYAEKALTSKTIAPYNSINGIIFVGDQDFKPHFSCKLIDQASGEQFIVSTTNQQLQL